MTIALLVLFGASYAAQLIVENTSGISLLGLLALTYDWDVSLAWRWLTYPLVEVSPVNRLLGMVFGYMVLAQHEATHGARSTLLVTLAGIVGAAVFCLPFGLLGQAMPLVGMSAVIWAPLGVLLVTLGDRPVAVFTWVLPNAKVAAGVLLLLPAASSLYDRDPMPLLEAIGAAAGGFLVFAAPWRGKRSSPSPKKKPLRKHGFKVIQGGGQRGDDDDERPKWLN